MHYIRILLYCSASYTLNTHSCQWLDGIGRRYYQLWVHCIKVWKYCFHLFPCVEHTFIIYMFKKFKAGKTVRYKGNGPSGVKFFHIIASCKCNLNPRRCTLFDPPPPPKCTLFEHPHRCSLIASVEIYSCFLQVVYRVFSGYKMAQFEPVQPLQGHV